MRDSEQGVSRRDTKSQNNQEASIEAHCREKEEAQAAWTKWYEATYPYGEIEGTEQPTEYKPGGFHPTYIGDRLHDRYTIVNKLGYGGFGTVWLARDTLKNVLVAVKISQAASADSCENEMFILQQLAANTLGIERYDPYDTFIQGGRSSLILPLLDHFRLDGPNGRHSCLVTEAASKSLKHSGSHLRLEHMRAIAAQIVLAVSWMHSNGHVHGDIHHGNIFLRLPHDIHGLSDIELYERFEGPCKDELIRRDGQPRPLGVPAHIYWPAPIGLSSKALTLRDCRIFLADFGTSFSPYREIRTSSYSPLQFRPPEAEFEPCRPVSFHSDIWSLGCLLWSLMSNRSLFSYTGDPDRHIFMQYCLLGAFPNSWWEKLEPEDKHYDPRQFERADIRQRLSKFTLESILQKNRVSRVGLGLDSASAEEETAFLTMIRLMLVYIPEERATIQQVLDCEWIQRWALPELQRLNSAPVVTAEDLIQRVEEARRRGNQV